MVQRALIAACLLVMLASLLLLGLVSHQSNQALRASTDANRRVAELFAEAQASNQAKMAELFRRSEAANAEMLKQVQTTAKASESSQSPDWIPVTFKLTRETVDGPPVNGCQVTLQKGSPGFFDQGIRRESDSAGLVDFGVVHPGDWEFELSVPYDDQHTWKSRGTLNVLPGTKVVKTVVCPKPILETSAVKLHVQWPPDLAAKNLRVEATFVQKPIVFQPPLKWTVFDSAGDERSRAILYGPGAKQTVIGGATRFDLWRIYRDGSLGVQTVFGDFHGESAQSRSDPGDIESGNFLLRRVILLRPVARGNSAIKGERFEVLAHTEVPAVEKKGPDLYSGEVKTFTSDPDSGDYALGIGWRLRDFKGSVTVAPAYWRQLEERFVARPGQVNDWTLPLPEELINAVREELKGNEDKPRPSASPEG